jgi:hypothetical protein
VPFTAEGDMSSQVIQKNETGLSNNPTAEIATNGHFFPVASATSPKAQTFPSSELSKDKVSLSEFNSVRKKRLSLFGKIKDFFLPDKNDKKNQK